MSESNCPTRKQLLDYSAGKDLGAASKVVETHAYQCPACQAVLDTIDSADDTLLSRLRRPVDEDQYAAETPYHIQQRRQ